MKLETIALHHGYDSDKNDQKAATTPIYQSSVLRLTTRSMVQIYLILKWKAISIQE